MNKSNLKSYAPQARKDFIAAITARAALLGITADRVVPATVSGGVAIIDGVEWPAKVATQRDALLARIARHGADGFARTMEEVAYTWFNRFAALRYMELHELLDHGHRVLSSRDGGLPELLRHAAEVTLPGLQPAQVQALQLAGNQDNQLYKLLLVAQCNELSRTMPFLFERIDDDTELLLPDHLLRTDSIIAKLVAGVPEEDWQEIEVIGWLYQFYISEKKDQVIGKVVKSEDIPAATQLFTPNWIVQYLVQNSVGRLWLMANPGSQLASEWPYYIQPAEQTPEVQAQLDALIQTRIAEDGDTLNPETITCLDPACGSGHILVVAYDVLKAIYLERGYRLRDIPRLILEKNLYGLDIDDRAAQLAGFALLMKARADDRRLLADPDHPPKLNILSLQESQGLDLDRLVGALQTSHPAPQGAPTSAAPLPASDLFPETQPQMILAESVVPPLRTAIATLLDCFTHAKTFGSLIQIGPQANDYARYMLSILRAAEASGDLYAQAAAKDLLPLVRQAQVLGMQFDAVVANPPYMGGKWMSPQLKSFIEDRYPEGKADLFGAFDLRIVGFLRDGSLLGCVQPFLWMFLSTYESLRRNLLENASLTSLVQLEYNGFEPACVPVCTFVALKIPSDRYIGTFFDLSDFKGIENQEPKFKKAIDEPLSDWRHLASTRQFNEIPTSPIAYWVSERFRQLFASGKKIEDVAFSKVGLQTGDNDRFVRFWYEVSLGKVGFNFRSRAEAAESNKKWFPHLKGGGFRRWYGNFEVVVDWENDGQMLKVFGTEGGGRARSRTQNLEFYFKPGITWSDLTSSYFGSRQVPDGFIGSPVGPCLFVKPGKTMDGVLGYTNSRVFQQILDVSLQGLHYNNGVIGDRPYIPPGSVEVVKKIEDILVAISKGDWDSNETSWEFIQHSLLLQNSLDRLLKSSWGTWKQGKDRDFLSMKNLEEKNNNFWIDAYGLQDELSPEVPEDQITLARADREKDCQRLISYAIGCMMGRYSLDAPGLIYAHAGNVGFDPSRYPSFPADADGILPVTDQPWFADDAAARVREFLHAVWGPDTLEENLAWLAESLGPKGSETPEETIRRYIANQFFKDHLQTYKKRPIYWLFSSGKQGAFQALVYLHRYHEGTLARMRSEYVIPLTAKYAARLDLLAQDATAATSAAARTKINKQIETLRKQQAELLAFDEKLRHYADLRISLDLDDGVKVNYGKFGDLLAGVKIVTGGSADD